MMVVFQPPPPRECRIQAVDRRLGARSVCRSIRNTYLVPKGRCGRKGLFVGVPFEYLKGRAATIV